MQDPAPHLSRRTLLTSAAALAALPALPYAAAHAAPAHAAAAAAPGIHIVDGWVLTTADLQALGLHAR